MLACWYDYFIDVIEGLIFTEIPVGYGAQKPTLSSHFINWFLIDPNFYETIGKSVYVMVKDFF